MVLYQKPDNLFVSNKSENIKQEHDVKQIFDNHHRFIGAFIKFSSGVVIGCDASGSFCGKFDGCNTFSLPDMKFHSTGLIGLYELVLKATTKIIEKSGSNQQ